MFATELLWQGENIVDLRQSLRGRNCDQEVGTVGTFFGRHPSTGETYASMVVFGIGHYAVTQLLVNAGWDKAARAWSYVSLGLKTRNMIENYRAGTGF